MFQPNHRSDRLEVLVACPSAESHFDDRHAERLEMLVGQRGMFFWRQFGKAQFNVAAHDRSARATDPVREPTHNSSDSKSRAMRQQAKQSQESHAEPGRPKSGCPVAGKGLSNIGHSDRSLLGHAVYVTTDGRFLCDIHFFLARRDLIGLDTDMKGSKPRHHNLISSHADDASGIR